ncbi:MAG: hypothetical protein HQL08_07850 [Nitrospirae bacterium]|nr:hypothetical protein [Nitrospirota bacterium]
MRKKKNKRVKQEAVTYAIEIMDYDMPYYIAVGHKLDILPEPILENADLEIKGKMLAPGKLANKILNIRIMGSRKMLDALEHQGEINHEIPGIGTLEIRGTHAQCITGVPIDMIQSFILLLNTKKINYIILSGEPLRYGSAKIKSLGFSREYNQDDAS